PTGGLVAQDAGDVTLFDERVNDVVGEPVGKEGEGGIGDDAGNFPVAEGGVLGGAFFGGLTEGALGFAGAGHTADVDNIAESEFAKMRKVESVGRGLGNVPDGVRARVAKGFSIGQLTTADSVENN